MAFPYIFESNFEGGTNAEWTTGETDTGTILDFPSFRTLAAHGMEPYSGAYCMRILSPGTPADAYVSAPECNIADGVTSYFRFNIFFAPDFACTATDVCPILELQGAANAATVAFGFRIAITTNLINFGVGGANTGAVPDNLSAEPVERGVWYTIELCVYIDTGGGGTVGMYVSRRGGVSSDTVEAEAETITNIAVTHAVFGLHDPLATTTGYILLDNFVQDNARLYNPNRYPEVVPLTKTAHAFVGPGQIEELVLLPGSAAGVVSVYDSDCAETVDLVATVSAAVANETVTRVTPINVSRGAYCVLTGQGDPRALAKLKYASHSAGSVRDVGSKPR